MDERSYWIGFSVFPGIGPVRFGLLRKYFGSAKAAWEAPVTELEATGLGAKLTASFDTFRAQFDIDAYMRKLATEKVTTLLLSDARYPKLLAQIPDAPFVLYIKGKKPHVPIDLNRTIGIVGTRKITNYG